ncbi:MAG: hypothetical protein VXV90_00975 [Pseudomonadota bacterium]|nr:hypothetical protein [Pseudomonadota bacterium]
MIKNFLIINCIGKDDKLGLRINKDFFIHNFTGKKNVNEQLVSEIFSFLNNHNVVLDKNFTVLVNQGPGSFSGIRVSLAVAKGLEISKKVRLFGYKNSDLKLFDVKNIEKLLDKNLIEKKLIKPIYLS